MSNTKSGKTVECFGCKKPFWKPPSKMSKYGLEFCSRACLHSTDIPSQYARLRKQSTRYAECHPDRKHRANGLCELCYAVWWRKESMAKIRHKYGLSKESYYKMVEAQDGLCAVCHEVRELVVDHDHVSGIVRGLLCQKCNAGLGFFAEQIDVLNAAIHYLKYATV